MRVSICTTVVQYQCPGRCLPSFSVKNWKRRAESGWGITPLTPDPIQITISTQDHFHTSELSSSAEHESASAVSGKQSEAGGGNGRQSKLVFLENLSKGGRENGGATHDARTVPPRGGSRCGLQNRQALIKHLEVNETVRPPVCLHLTFPYTS